MCSKCRSRTHACFESHTPLVNGCIDDVLFNAAPNVQQTLSQFVNISNLCLVDVLLHCSPDFVVHRVKIWTVRWPLFRWNKVRRVSRRKSSIVSWARCAGALSCWNTNSFSDTCLMASITSTSAAHPGNKTIYFHPGFTKKHSVQPRFETPTDTMTVSLNVGRVRKRSSDACMRSGDGHFEHMP